MRQIQNELERKGLNLDLMADDIPFNNAQHTEDFRSDELGHEMAHQEQGGEQQGDEEHPPYCCCGICLGPEKECREQGGCDYCMEDMCECEGTKDEAYWMQGGPDDLVQQDELGEHDYPMKRRPDMSPVDIEVEDILREETAGTMVSQTPSSSAMGDVSDSVNKAKEDATKNKTRAKQKEQQELIKRQQDVEKEREDLESAEEKISMGMTDLLKRSAADL